MADGEGKCFEKKLLYEIEQPGVLYMTLDGHDPVYVGFQSKLKLEIRLVLPNGLAQNVVNAGKLDVKPEDVHIQQKGLLNGAENLASHESFQSDRDLELDNVSLEAEDHPVLNTSCENNVDSNHFIGKAAVTCTTVRASKRADANKSKFVNPRANTGVERSLVKPGPSPKQLSKKQTEASGRKAGEKPIVELQKNSDEELQKIREKARMKLLLSRQTKNTKSVVLSRSQLSIFLNKFPKKSGVDGGEPAVSPDSNEQVNDRSEKKSHQDIGEKASTSKDIHSQEVSLSCKYCANTFPSRKEYYKHRKYTPLNYHVCLQCNTAFPYRAYLIVHMKYHNEKGQRRSYNCDKCNFKSTNTSDLKKHTLVHTFEHSYQCCQCKKTFPAETLLLKHLAKHRPKGVIKCSCCNEYFPSRGALADHKMVHQQYKCGLCGQMFPNKTSRLIHYRADHKDNILKCPQCGRMYSTQEEFASHLKMHRQRRRQQCPICGAMVLKLPPHLRTHKSIEEMPDSELFMCDQCPSKFKSSSHLRTHMRKHSNKKLYKCHLCSKECSSRGLLSRHLLNLHSSLMPYQCEICGKQCKQRGNLKIHMRIHSNTKMFPCNFCDQAFNYKASLQGHLRSKHSMEPTAGSDVAAIGKNSTISDSSCRTDHHTDIPASTSNTTATSEVVTFESTQPGSSYSCAKEPASTVEQNVISRSRTMPVGTHQNSAGLAWPCDLPTSELPVMGSDVTASSS